MTYEELKMLKENLELLSNERDPKTGYLVDDTILKNSFNKQVLNDAIMIIDKLLKLDFNPTAIDKRKKYAFYLSDEDKSQIIISREPISVSAFVYNINEKVDDRVMKKLKAVQVTSWLERKGYLEEIEHDDGRKFKITTEKSASIGISHEERTSECGRKYCVNLYNEDAQRFIIEHLDEIVENNIDIL